MNKFLAKNNTVFLVIISLIIACLTAIYINLYTGSIDLTSSGSQSSIAILKSLRWWNILLLLIVLFLGLQYYITNISRKHIKVNLDELVTNILKAACESLIYPHKSRHIRAIITITDKDNITRTTKFTYNADQDPERVASFPVNFGVTGEAFRTKSVILKELDKEHHDDYTDKIKDNILPKVRTILAAPILDTFNNTEKPIGILAFDSRMALSTLKWDQDHSRVIAQTWADVIAKILTYSES